MLDWMIYFPCHGEKYGKSLLINFQIWGVHIPRYLEYASQHHVLILTICDTSKRGYGAVVFLQYFVDNGDSKIYLLKAKTRLSSLICHRKCL